jgi:hypothetical protein
MQVVLDTIKIAFHVRTNRGPFLDNSKGYLITIQDQGIKNIIGQ